ncbi:TAXI family TRAP transporter solute-binding subunit [Actimicrobium sp. CCC2.4]|uniref:TAXI family TRAP transporter solute-binding subunit n=1 Tax=Actimicrobium sp. CCC2.4 TaxID=3048606 RepID=UPI002AC910D6|nr:TAXI family TRAP transporter solute-binding subunit [Actimicrobium sp. CCC2.4]MEB0136576.1 TAXI family TRAP transporter solute-binding subunit [Actimicrobium sp. CCC2.4]WPX31738.1 TAXI family TRAP transporter solute-binding subunit [Actimicrobium sp. CCC2.4]
MPKIFDFTRFSLRDLFATAAPTLLAIAVVGLLVYWLADPSPPSRVTMSTGQENSAYELIGKKYAAELAQRNIKVTLAPSLGSQENLQRLMDPDSGIDIGFVQSGSTEQDAAERQGLISLGSLFSEPVWLFYRDSHDITQLNQLKGLQINVGPEGTGVPLLFRRLLSVNGIEPVELTLGTLENTPATVALLAGTIDGMVFSSAPDELLIQMLLQTPGIKLFDFTQAEAYTRRFPFLSHVVLPRGIVDLGRDLPARDYQLIAPTATLVARASMHPALVDLFVQSATNIHGGAGWFHKRNEFPTANFTEVPVAAAAAKFYQTGPSFLQHYFPFWLSSFMERMWVVVVAVGALFIPLSRIVPPLYVWKVRSRVYRWYGQLRAVEQAIEGVLPPQRRDVYAHQLARLNQIEEKVNQISIPLSFAEELYGLRSHINFVRKRILGLQQVAEG